MMVNTSDDDDDDDDNNNNNNCLMTSSSSHHLISKSHNFMCTIQNPSYHTEEVSGIMKRMWVDLLTVELSLS